MKPLIAAAVLSALAVFRVKRFVIGVIGSAAAARCHVCRDWRRLPAAVAFHATDSHRRAFSAPMSLWRWPWYAALILAAPRVLLVLPGAGLHLPGRAAPPATCLAERSRCLRAAEPCCVSAYRECVTGATVWAMSSCPGRAHFWRRRSLNAKLLPPAFGLNRRGYWRHFKTSPDDWIYHRALQKLLPVVEFTEADYLAHGGGSAVTALCSFIAEHKLHERRVFAFVTEGLWGGYSHVQAAREFMRSTLYQSRYAARNLLQLQSRIDPHKILVGMHVRLGDFVAPTSLGRVSARGECLTAARLVPQYRR